MSISRLNRVLLAAAAAGALALGSAGAGAQMRSGGGYSDGGMSGSTMPSHAMGHGSMSGTSSGAAYGSGMMMDRGAHTGGAVIGPGGMAADSGAFDDWNNRIAPAWEQYRGRILVQFGRITPADLAATNGERSDVVALIQQRYNLSNERAHERLWQWQRGVGMRAGRNR